MAQVFVSKNYAERSAVLTEQLVTEINGTASFLQV